MLVAIVLVGRAGVVVTNAFPKIITPQHATLNVISTDKNIQAFVVDEHVSGYSKLGEFREMNAINLHEPHIVGAVLVVRDFSSRATFGANDGLDQVGMRTVMSRCSDDADLASLASNVRTRAAIGRASITNAPPDAGATT